MNKDSKIYIAGHKGLVGSAILNYLLSNGYTNILTRTHAELDLIDQAEVDFFFKREKPEYVFLAAAKVGGIGSNSTYPADFIYQNIMIGFNVVHAAYRYNVKKLVNLGSSCIYPKMAPQPIRKEYLLTGELELTNEAYAVAKIAVIKLCNAYNTQYKTNFLSVMPTNLYGPGDSYDLMNSHVLPALIRKVHEAKVNNQRTISVWGDGSPMREFLFSTDLAEAVVFLMQNKDWKDIGEFINIGTGIDITIKDLVDRVISVVYQNSGQEKCTVEWDKTKPNGTPRKLLDISKIRSLGWKPKIELDEGITLAYADFLKTKNK